MKAWVGSGDFGALVDMESATVSAQDHGFTVGDGVFETMKVRDGRLFLWPWHLERLRESAAVMRIPLPDETVLWRAVSAVTAANREDAGDATTRLRLTLSAGIGPLGSARDTVAPTVVCAQSAMPDRSGPARLATMPWPRNERSPLAGVKCTSYAENVLALARANALGADEALFWNSRGELCEGAMSNVFVVLDGAAITPPLSAGVLAGTSRRLVLSLAGAGINVREEVVGRELLATAEEVFITSTFADVRAVTAVDDRAFAEGPVTTELARRFSEAARDPRRWT